MAFTYGTNKKTATKSRHDPLVELHEELDSLIVKAGRRAADKARYRDLALSTTDPVLRKGYRDLVKRLEQNR